MKAGTRVSFSLVSFSLAGDAEEMVRRGRWREQAWGATVTLSPTQLRFWFFSGLSSHAFSGVGLAGGRCVGWMPRRDTAKWALSPM